jgi:multidrug efflux pump subunit AcrB
MGQELRENIGEIAGAEKFSISSSFGDFGSPLSVALYSKDADQLDSIIQQIRDKLKTYPGVFDIQDNSTSGKEEIQLTLKPLAKSLGLSLADISSQLRNAVYGYEAQRIQRAHDEMKVMVRYPLGDRSSIVDVENLPITVRNSEQTIPLSDLVVLQSGKSPSAIYHKEQIRTDTVKADLDIKNKDSALIRDDLKKFLDELLRYHPDISYDMDGQAKNQQEAASSLFLGLILVLLIIYCLLAIPFKSFSQPLIVMSVIPISFVGAMIGHLIMGQSLSILSFMGILALSGVVVNDSLVLVDYINKQRERGHDLMQAVLTAGQVRFRPVMLTSLTTFVGLLPLMTTTNVNAKTLVPMAISLGFGIVFATMITLIIVPVNYLIFTRIGEIKQNIKRKLA